MDMLACAVGAHLRMRRYFTPDGERLYSSQVRLLERLESGSRPRTQNSMRSLIALRDKGVVAVDFATRRKPSGEYVPSQDQKKLNGREIRILISSSELIVEETNDFDAE